MSGHELLTALNAFVFEGTRHPRRRQRPAEKTAQCPEECSSVHTHPVQRAASGDTEEASGDTEEIVMEGSSSTWDIESRRNWNPG